MIHGSNDAEKVSDWEKHLADIIEQTNRNIGYLSKSARNKEVNALKKFYGPDDPSPLFPSPLFTGGAGDQSVPLPPPPTAAKTKVMNIKTDHFQRQAKEMICTGSRVGNASRPLQKHVEDDLTRRIGHSIKRSVERTISEKSHSNQARIDRLHDQLEHLQVDNLKVRKECGVLSRSIASQDRLSKRLKDEWERQRSILKALDAAIIKDLGWKESTSIDLKMLKDSQLQDSTLRVTSDDIRSAMEAITSKMMVAVDRTTTALRNGFESEIAKLKDENRIIKENLDESLKSFVSIAIESHLKRTEAKISSSVLNDIFETKRKNSLANQLISDGDFRKHLNALVEEQYNKNTIQQNRGSEEKLKNHQTFVKDVVTQIDELKSMIKTSQKCTNTKCADCEVLESRVLELEQNIQKMENACKKKDMQTVSSDESKIDRRLNQISDDISLIYNESKMYTDIQVQSLRMNISDEGQISRTELSDMEELRKEHVRIKEVCKKDVDGITRKVYQIREDILLLDTNSKLACERLQKSFDRVHDLQCTGIDRIDKLQEEMNMLHRMCAGLETRTQTSASDLQRELCVLREGIIRIQATDEKAHSSLTDLVSYKSKISDLENKINVEMSLVRREFVNLQDNIIDLNISSRQTLETLIKKVNKNISPDIHTECKGQQVILKEGNQAISSLINISKCDDFHQTLWGNIDTNNESLERNCTLTSIAQSRTNSQGEYSCGQDEKSTSATGNENEMMKMIRKSTSHHHQESMIPAVSAQNLISSLSTVPSPFVMSNMTRGSIKAFDVIETVTPTVLSIISASIEEGERPVEESMPSFIFKNKSNYDNHISCESSCLEKANSYESSFESEIDTTI